MIGIISAMNKEVESLIQLLIKPKKITILTNHYWVGKFDNHDVVISVCGIGKVNAGIGCLLMIEHFKPRLIINTGVAGGYSEQLKPLDVIIANKVSYYDVDLTSDNNYLGQLPNLPFFFESDKKAVKIASQVLFNEKVFQGVILSGDCFQTNRNNLIKVIERHPLNNCLAIDMESASIAQVCHINQVPFLIVRSISDIIGAPKQVESYYDFVNQAIEQALIITKEVINKY